MLVKQEVEQTQSGEILQWTILIFALCLTTIFQRHLFLGKFGWFLLVLLGAIKSDYAVYAAFFYGALFHASGFFPDLFFTVKHFHIAISLLTAILFLKSELWIKVKANYKSSFILLIPWILIILISTIATVVNSQDQIIRGLRTNANILTLLLSSFILICVIDRKRMIINALLAYAFGVTIRLILAGLSFKLGEQFFYSDYEYLFYNNHIGFLCASAVFILFSFIVISKPELKASHYIISSFLLVTTFTGLLLSCSRTGWFAFVFVSVMFGYFFNLMRKSQHTRDAAVSRSVLVIMALSFALIVEIGIFMNQDVFSRITSLDRFFDPTYLWFVINERTNFGPFGIFRLNQFYSVREILSRNYLIGVGLVKVVTDFHSLYLTLLGGTGILGFALFFRFAIQWSRKLLDRLSRFDDGTNLIRLGIFSAFLVWLLYSFMESFVVQFNIWIVLTVGTILCDRTRVERMS